MIDPSSSEEEDDDGTVARPPTKPPHMQAGHKGPPAGVRIEHANGHGPQHASPMRHPGAEMAKSHPTHPNRDTTLRKDNVQSDSSGSLAPGPSLPRTPSPSSTLSQDTADAGATSAASQRHGSFARSNSPTPSMTSDKNEVQDPHVSLFHTYQMKPFLHKHKI